MNWWLSLIIAALGGGAMTLAFPPFGWWPLIFLGVALIVWSLRGRGAWMAFLTGTVAGFSFFGTHLLWLTTYLGLVPWLALAGLESLFFGLGAVLITLAWRWLPMVLPNRWWTQSLVIPAVVAAVWTLREQVTSVWPYGGFSWGRLAFSQSQSPLGDLAAWVGASGLTFLIAFVSVSVVQVWASRATRVQWRLAVPASILLVMVVMPVFPVTTTGTMRVAAVQGNADAGLFSQRERGAILDDHLQATVPVLDEDVDLIVWPENAADLNPLRYQQAAAVLDFVTEKMDAPMIVGTITDGEEDETYNSLLLWEPGEGATQQYDKIHPVPFAEYLPDRDFWYPFAPSLFDLIPRDFSIGTRPNVFDIDGVTAGLAICFDIVDDALLHQMVGDGAEIIIAPTNNADFGRSSESVQQLAIARLRALEYGRSVVNTSTVGTSAIIAPDGSTIDELPTFEPGAMVDDVPLSETRTPASVIGMPLAWSISGLAALLVLAAGVLARRRRGGAAPPDGNVEA